MISPIQTNKDISYLVSETFDLPIFFISPNGEVMYERLRNRTLNPLYENHKKNLFNPLGFDASIQHEFPIIKKSAFLEKFILISVLNNHQSFIGTLIIGPTMTNTLSEDRITGILNDANAFFHRDKVIQYYKSIPIIKPDKLLNISIIVYQMFNGVLLDPVDVKNKNIELTAYKDNNEKIDLVISDNLQTNTFHDRLFEKRMLEIIKEGRKDELKNLPSLKEEEIASVLSKSSYTRSIKNHIITLITLASRAAIEGGVHDEVALGLHDKFIQQIEEVNQLSEVKKVAKEVLYTFAGRVQQVKSERYSKTISLCKDYMFKHLYQNISHNDIANYVEISPKYLSVLFKKEVGVSVSEYMQQIKINESKKLLAYSKSPISEICTLLNFNDQSYFTKVFKKIVGITPKLYRERHHLMESK
ncbi:helix-turn-helix domain-containing protein [Halalkalibacter urbisdiaboli]|uniref:helix-turn-helix domain-containing protein n=1 Tax=Halalkalibacter urbisdiaboli TaxID=1960589 RepID=UPI000B44E7C0|nr:helix-turn-helix domain-containing protein [Halalkalibacter urbisdiaboli]